METPLTTSEIVKVQQSEPTQENVCIAAMKQVFPKDTWAVATAIMKAESGLIANRKSDGHDDEGHYDYGCWQIHNWELYDPLENTNAAYYKYTHYGWTPWVAFTSGSYKRFL